MEEYIGWYIRKGVLAVERLIGQGAICLKAGDHYKLQFHNRELPMCDTHSWGIFHKNDVLLLRAVEDDFVFLEYCGKHYRRRIRNGKFQFHNLELTCHSETAARTTTAEEHETTTRDNN